MNEPAWFVYGGHHFLPVGKLKKGENSFFRATQHCRSDRALGMSTYDWRRFDYNYNAFYGASTDKGSDLFLCRETGQVYIPAANELFIFTERRQVSSIRKRLGPVLRG